ncbi:MAG: recombinase family protein [Clostridiales bacterium]|nr:recombinase family protein [Clostridiales bacterium]
MARTSKRKTQLSCYEVKIDKMEIMHFQTAVYARLSVDSTEKKNESIENQIAVAEKYINENPNMTIAGIYTDLGATGTDFERTGFQKMLMDIRMKKINCVVVKDFSRFGRNYIETGNYLEKIFPFMGVRFISVTDQYDSLRASDSNEKMGTNLKNIVNELYARDIAIRVETSKREKLKQGSYVGGIPSYGFTKKKTGDKCILIPEQGTSEIVRSIYGLYDSGMGLMEIIRDLYEKKIHRPTEYQRTGHIYAEEGDVLKQWSETTLASMLTNPVYIGTLIQKQGKVELPIIVENAHETIVSNELFYRVAAKFEKSKKDRSIFQIKGETEPDIFREILFCGECGHKLKRVCTAKKQSYNQILNRYVYGCPNIGRIDEQKCESHYIPAKTIEKIVLETVKKEFALSKAKMKDYIAFNHEIMKEKKEKLQSEETVMRKKMEGIQSEITSCYIRYRQNKISQEAFLEIKKERRDILEKSQMKISSESQQIDRKEEQINAAIRSLIKWNGQSTLDAEFISVLIKRIDVYSDQRVEIQFNFRKEELFLSREGGTGR